jgi:preprotein translocase subunit YajC
VHAIVKECRYEILLVSLHYKTKVFPALALSMHRKNAKRETAHNEMLKAWRKGREVRPGEHQ